MRILLVAGSYPPEPCGIGDYTQKLAEALASRPDLKVAVLAKRDSAPGRDPNLEVIGDVGIWGFADLSRIVRHVRAWSPDLVHIQYPAQGFFYRRLPNFLPLIFRLLGFRVVETWHEPPPHSRKAMVYFLLPLLGATGLVFVRPAYLDFFSPWIRRWLSRLPNILIQNTAAVPVSTLDMAERQALRNKFLEKGYSRLLVFFGFINRNKGLECLFDIAEHGLDRIVIAGKVGDESYALELVEIARKKGLGEAVVFTGYLSPEDAADLLAVGDAVVLPFIDGGGNWNTSIHSAAAQGTFVITTGVDGLGFDPERNMYVTRPSDISEMRAAVSQYAGRKVIKADGESGWQRNASAHAEFYRLCLAGRPEKS
jgi:glycosyltransferase involved in cell wall biosynthesis